MSIYRSPSPFRKPTSYRGLDTLPAVSPPGYASTLRAAWDSSAANSQLLSAPLRQATPRGATVRAPISTAAAQAALNQLHFGTPTGHDATLHARWGWTGQVYRKRATYRKARSYRGTEIALDPARHAVAEMPWRRASPHDQPTRLPHAETADRLGAATAMPWRRATPHDLTVRTPWDTLQPHGDVVSAVWRALAARNAFVALPWGPIGARQNGYVTPWPVEPNPGDPGSDPITVPILPVYVMIPTMSAVRLPERTPVRLLSATISTDAASWGWTFTASLPADDLPLVTPQLHEDPVELEITVCGYVWTFLVDSDTDQRRFALKSATIAGRSRSAILAQPYAPARSRLQTLDRTIAQLGDEELVGTGWTLLWDALDFLVPGGTWSYADLAPIDALSRLAASIGARLETDRAALELRAKPLYAVSPWEWGAATPYAILPSSIVSTADGSWQGGPNANGVYVYGENAGFGALVKLEGTSGEIQIPMVVERLAVSADPARERGRQELAKAGKIRAETVRIPLFPSPADPGLIPIGALLDITDRSGPWRGQCQGVRIDAVREGSAFSVRQTLQVERHFR
jgi:hypothetical protein